MKIQSIALSPQQDEIVKSVLTCCNKIESKMLTTINHENPLEIETQLADLLLSLGDVPRLMAHGVAIYDTAKGLVGEEAINNPDILNAKQIIQKMYFDGRLAKYNSIYVRVENLAKDLRNSVEGLRSLLSYQKELIRSRVFEESKI